MLLIPPMKCGFKDPFPCFTDKSRLLEEVRVLKQQFSQQLEEKSEKLKEKGEGGWGWPCRSASSSHPPTSRHRRQSPIHCPPECSPGPPRILQDPSRTLPRSHQEPSRTPPLLSRSTPNPSACSHPYPASYVASPAPQSLTISPSRTACNESCGECPWGPGLG